MTVHICLIRHGETAWNASGRLQGRTDTPLSDVGRQQVMTLGPAMAHLQAEKRWSRWHALYSSPLQRAMHTAQPISDHLGIQLTVDADLSERCFGEMEGQTRAERDARFPNWRDEEHLVQGLETADELKGRARSVMDRMLRSHQGENVIVVSHGGFLNVFMALVQGDPQGTDRHRFSNASYTLLRYTYNNKGGEGVWDILDAHRTDHLEV